MVQHDQTSATACDAFITLYYAAIEKSLDAHKERVRQAELAHKEARDAAEKIRNEAVRIAYVEWDALIAPEKINCGAQMFEIRLLSDSSRLQRAEKLSATKKFYQEQIAMWNAQDELDRCVQHERELYFDAAAQPGLVSARLAVIQTGHQEARHKLYTSEREDLSKLDEEWRENNDKLSEAATIARKAYNAAINALPQDTKIAAEALSKAENIKYQAVLTALQKEKEARLQASHEQLTAEGRVRANAFATLENAFAAFCATTMVA